MPLIRIKTPHSTKSHPNRNVRGEDTAKRLIETGMARVALQQLDAPTKGCDAYGQPLSRAAALGQSASPRRLNRFAKIAHRRNLGSALLIGIGCRGCSERRAPHSWPCEDA